MPRKANDTFDTPPEVREPGNSTFSRATASMNETAYALCSSIPVAIAKMFASRMMSSGRNPTTPVSRSYARRRTATRRSTDSAWPCSSKAMTTTAAP